MRTFQIYFATSLDSENLTGSWGIALVEDQEVIYESCKFELEQTDKETLELAAIKFGLTNLENIRSEFRVLICYEKGQLNKFGSDHNRRKKQLLLSLAKIGQDVSSKKYSLGLNQVMSSKVYSSLQNRTQTLLNKEIASHYW